MRSLREETNPSLLDVLPAYAVVSAGAGEV
jgi:hypothetical protein